MMMMMIFNVSEKRRAGRYADIVYTNLNYSTGVRLHLTLLFAKVYQVQHLLPYGLLNSPSKGSPVAPAPLGYPIHRILERASRQRLLIPSLQHLE
jgi:hypothetical protein